MERLEQVKQFVWLIREVMHTECEAVESASKAQKMPNKTKPAIQEIVSEGSLCSNMQMRINNLAIMATNFTCKFWCNIQVVDNESRHVNPRKSQRQGQKGHV